MKEIRIYFGRQKGDGEIVSEENFWYFIKFHLLNYRSFENFTIIPSIGVWKQEKELSTILEFIIEGTKQEELLIEEVCKKYCTLFQQQSVLVTTKEVKSILYESTGK